MSNARRLVPLALALLASPALAQDVAGEAARGPDEGVIPAQYTVPPGLPAGVVADPPSPTVRVQVRVPSTVAPGKDLAYRIVVTNTSPADAYRVTVRDPLPDGVARIVAIDPPADGFDPKKPPAQLPRELAWSIGTLRGGEARTIELTLTLKPDAKEVRNQAYVAFEHGQAVVTKVERPKLAVRKSAPEQATKAGGVAVVVEVSNPGRVPVADVELVEDVTKGFSFAAGTTGEKGSEPTQRVWDLGTLQPGERKLVRYQLTAADATPGGAELLASSVVKSPDVAAAERSESTTKVLAPGVSLDLTGPPIVATGETGLYEIVARNTGTLTLTDVRVTASVPAGCEVAKMTRGGQPSRDRLVWVVPRMSTGEAYSVRYGLRASATGKQTIRAAVVIPDGTTAGAETSRELVTAFEGSPDLTWDATADPSTTTAGQQGLLTVRVRNTGTEAAKGVRLRVNLPADTAQFVQATPKGNRASANVVSFDEATIPAGGQETYTVTYKVIRAGQAWFVLRLDSDSLGDRPLTKEQVVEVVGSR